jgi:hypothetical protein
MEPSRAGLSDAVKEVGLVLTAASGVGYACGYLVMRARAYALGTDPGFSFIDQAYVWAGIRLLLMLLFAVLISALPVLFIRALGGQFLRLGARPLAVIEAAAAVLLGVAVMLLAINLFGVSNVIFADPHGGLASPLAAAVLGRNALGTVLFVGSTALALLIAFWIRSRVIRAKGLDATATLLLVMGFLLCALLPIQHGFFFAERKVRQLERLPEGVTGLILPIWIVEQGAGGRVVLLGRDAAGAARLVATKADKLDGIAVTAVTDLGDVLMQDRAR